MRKKRKLPCLSGIKVIDDTHYMPIRETILVAPSAHYLHSVRTFQIVACATAAHSDGALAMINQQDEPFVMQEPSMMRPGGARRRFEASCRVWMLVPGLALIRPKTTTPLKRQPSS